MSKHPKRITFAPRTRLELVEHLAARFFREVIGHEYEECLITDESDLLDFVSVDGDHGAELEEMLDRMEAHYLIGGRSAGSTRIVHLLEFLQSKGVGR